MHYIKQYPLSILTTVVVIALSLLPIGSVEIAQDVPLADKWTHMVMYAGLTAVCCWERRGRGQGAKVKGLGSKIPLLYAIFLGGLMELMQAYCTNYRSGEWLDFVADSIGAVLGFLIVQLIMQQAHLLFKCSKHQGK